MRIVKRVLAVQRFLAGGEILEWRNLEEVAQGAGVPRSTCHRILETLVEEGWAQRGPRGWRQDLVAMLARARYAQEYLADLKKQMGSENIPAWRPQL
jgi:DNA-binding IclR family transcriptional regulator